MCPSQPAFVTATCTTFLRSGSDTTRDVLGIALVAPVLLPVGGVMAGINALGSIGDPDINASLAELPLGAPPPGGVDAWLAKLPAGAQLMSRDADMTRVGFHHRAPNNAASRPGAIVTFAHGVVSRLEGSRCILTPARTFQCERG